MNFPISIAAILLLTVSPAINAAPPTLEINAPTVSLSGKKIVVSCRGSKDIKHFKWKITPDTKDIYWSEDKKEFALFTDGKIKQFKIFLAASNDDGLDFIEHEIEIDPITQPVVPPEVVDNPNDLDLPESTDKRKALYEVLDQSIMLIEAGNLDSTEQLIDSIETFYPEVPKKLIKKLRGKDLGEIKKLLKTVMEKL